MFKLGIACLNELGDIEVFVTSLAKTDWKKVLNAVAMDSGSVNL